MMLGTMNALKQKVLHLKLTPFDQNLILTIKILRGAVDLWFTKVNSHVESSISNTTHLPLPLIQTIWFWLPESV